MPSRSGLLWKTKLPNVECAVLPASTTRPNPLVVGDLVVVSVFSPGAICALDKKSGNLVWRKSLLPFASEAVYSAGGSLFASTSQSIFALDPRNGATRWEFKPYERPGEWIYSRPVVHRGLLFFGDRTGIFRCLDAKTGKCRWQRRPSSRPNDQTNSTALVKWPRVVTASNNGVVVCFEAPTGKTVWRHKVDGPCTHELLRIGSTVVVPARSVYALDLRTGLVKYRLKFAGQKVYSAAVAGPRLLAVVGPDYDTTGAVPDCSGWELVIAERGRLRARRPIPGISALRTCTETGLAYLLDVASVDVIDPATGSSLASKQKLMMALPDVKNGILYGFADDRFVFAEAHRRGALFPPSERT